MTRKIQYIFLLFILMSCSSNVKRKNVVSSKFLEQQQKRNSGADIKLKNFKAYDINDTITVDLNGDNISDQAYFNTIKAIKKVIIIDGKTKSTIVVGNDISFKDIGSNFNWVDNWGITSVSETYSNVVVDGELVSGSRVELKNKSIVFRKKDVGGGMTTFKNGKFIWIHQAD